MRDGEDLLGRLGSDLLIAQDRFRSRRRKRDRNTRLRARIKKRCERCVGIRARTILNTFSACSGPDSSLKRRYEVIGEAI
jgi:hypothetical protein